VYILVKAAKGQIKNIGRKPENINGKIKFQDEIEVGVEIENKANTHVKVKKQNINTAQGIGVSVIYIYIIIYIDCLQLTRPYEFSKSMVKHTLSLSLLIVTLFLEEVSCQWIKNRHISTMYLTYLKLLYFVQKMLIKCLIVSHNLQRKCPVTLYIYR